MADAECSIGGCAKRARCRGWCTTHYARWRKHGDPLTVLPPVPPPVRCTQGTECLVETCYRAPLARGLCSNHYRAMRMYGDPLANYRRPKLSCRIAQCDRPARGHALCGTHYQRWYAHGDPTWERPTFAECVIIDCAKPPRSKHAPLCHMHYARKVRTGDPLIVREVVGRTMSSNGYVLVRRPGHDLAHADGWLYEHRLVLLGKIGPGEHPCFWCARAVSWDLHYPADVNALVVDHLNEVKIDNEPRNLVPACNPCNLSRDKLAG